VEGTKQIELVEGLC